MSDRIVLDASALLALLQQEPGGEMVKSILNRAVMSAVNIAEVLIRLERLEIVSEEALPLIEDAVNEIIPFDLKQASEVAELQKHVRHKGISLGNKACIALGIKLNAEIYTADKIWSQLDLENAKIKQIR
jgi:PIN domain nuclease of toxin-antitoxin system